MRDAAEDSREIAQAPGQDLLGFGIGVVALVLLLLSPWLVDRSGPDPFYKGPLIFPMMVLAFTVAGAMPSAVRILRRPVSLGVDGGGFPRRGAALFGGMCLFPLAIDAIGVQAATFAAVLGGLLIVRRRVPESLVVAAGLAIVVHLAFRSFLDVWFPAPWLLGSIGF